MMLKILWALDEEANIVGNSEGEAEWQIRLITKILDKLDNIIRE